MTSIRWMALRFPFPTTTATGPTNGAGGIGMGVLPPGGTGTVELAPGFAPVTTVADASPLSTLTVALPPCAAVLGPLTPPGPCKVIVFASVQARVPAIDAHSRGAPAHRQSRSFES